MSSSKQFYTPIRVRYSEIDGQKMVFNAHYLTYLDVAMVEYLREVIASNWKELAEKHIFDIALVNITIDFKQPARLDDLLHVYCQVKRLGNSSLTVSFSIEKENTYTIINAEAVYVNFNPATGKSQPIPSDIRSKIMQFEETAE
jgi:acyl-CoA thioester hydrolase